MKQKIELSHEQIVRYNRQADRVQDATRKRIDFLRMRTTELNGLAADSGHFQFKDRMMSNIFGAVLSNPALEKDKDKRTQLEKLRAEAMHEMCERVKAMRRGDQEAITELDALWREQIDLFVRAKSNFLMFFRPVTLAANEQVCYEHSYRNEIAVGYIGEDGGPRTRKAVKAQKQTFFDLKEIHTEEIGYQIRDINLGPDIAQLAQKTVDLAWEMEAKINDLAKTLYMTKFGSFTTTGAKLDRTYVANQYIETANLPTTNSLVCDDIPNTTTTKVRLDVIRKIMDYTQAWENIWGQPLTPTGVILIPSKHAGHLSLEFTPTGEQSNVVAERIVGGDYLRFNWFGRNWTLVPDVTLSPTAGYCYPVFDQPLGDYFSKPEYDETFVETNRRKNWETRSMMKAIQLCAPEPRRVNQVRVKYQS